MRNTVGKIPNLRGITSFRGDALSIDLGKTFTGQLRSWIVREGTNDTLVFNVVGNRYLTLSESQTEGVVIDDRWYFQVKETLDEGLATQRDHTVYQGTVKFIDNYTT